jgi:beta-fructofuranosidase
MFFESSWSRKSIGDVDVVFHEGLYHLFYLVLPNHDYIAHAISNDGINWRRVENALFIGNPGSWDDLMLWTMHVSPNPHKPGHWRMFYTGLTRRDQGKKQRVGLAHSEDLFRWTKEASNWEDLRGQADPEVVKRAREKLLISGPDNISGMVDTTSCFPLEPDPHFYEASVDEDREWVSFRDPFFCEYEGRGVLLVAARNRKGPLIRRGCVALVEETAPGVFEARAPLHAPMLYDDIEVPNLLKVDGRYFLVGSIREDAKIRYWHADSAEGPYMSFSQNVLLPRGNYASRVCHDGTGFLLWNFFASNLNDRSTGVLLPPPKRLQCSPEGELFVSTYEKILEGIEGQLLVTDLEPLLEGSDASSFEQQADGLTMRSAALFQGFLFPEELDSFHLSCDFELGGFGEAGLCIHVDKSSADGYYLSLDLTKGMAVITARRTDHLQREDYMMQYRPLQTGYWKVNGSKSLELRLVCFGSYYELSVNGSIVLSLADATFSSGYSGFYVESAELAISNLRVERLRGPAQSDDHLAQG